MADIDKISLLIEILGQDGLDKLAEAADRLKTKTKAAADTYEVLDTVVAKSVGPVGEYEVLERRVTETIRVQTTMLDQLGIQLGKNAGLYEVATAEAAAFGRAASSAVGTSGRGGQGVLGLSYAVQDFTSVLGTQGLGHALGAVQNNIPILVAALGAGAGLAGVISIVSVGVGLLVDNWGKLTGAWDKEETKAEAERMKELAKQTEEAAKQAERLAKTLPREQREEASAINKAIQEFGGPAVMKELSEALQARNGNFGPEANAAQARNLMANLARGDGRALELLGDLDLRGDIGEVLRGGQTPAERFKRARAADARQRQEADRARKQRDQEAEKAKREAEAEKRRRDAIDEADFKEADRLRAQQVQGGVELSRRVGRAAAKRQATPTGDLHHLPLMSMENTPAGLLQAQQAIVANQQAMTANMAALQQVQQEAKAVQQQQHRLSGRIRRGSETTYMQGNPR